MAAQVRVVFVITGLTTGGAEMMLLKLLRAVDRRRFLPHVVSLTSLGEVGPSILALGIPVDSMQMLPDHANFAALLRLWLLLRRLRPDILHTWLYHADLIAGIIGRLAGVRRIVWGVRHADLSHGANKRSTLAIAKICAWLSRWVPDRITVNSEVALQAHVRHGYFAERMVVIPNGFELSRFVPDAAMRGEVRRELGIASDTPLVGVIGRFHAQKNQLGFVGAMVSLHRHRPDVHFVFAGMGVGAENSQLMQLLRANGLLQVTHLLGQRRDVPRLMAALDVLALPSVGEAFPNVVGEAMACEVPCAVMDVGDSAAILGGTGRVVPPGDMDGLSDAIRELLALPSKDRKTLGRHARARVSRLFEIETVSRQYEALYEALVPDGGQG